LKWVIAVSNMMMGQEFLKTFKRQQGVSKDSNFNTPVEPIGKLNFIFHYVIGRGGFGQVWKV
jgi:hypothetical protein